MGRIISFEIKMDLIEFINQRVKEYENTAEECVQELGDEERADQYIAKAEALKELRDDIVDRIDIGKLIGTIGIK